MIDTILGIVTFGSLGVAVSALIASQVDAARLRRARHDHHGPQVLEADLNTVRQQVIAEMARRQTQYFAEEDLHNSYRVMFERDKESSVQFISALERLSQDRTDQTNLEVGLPNFDIEELKGTGR